jgi:hypothetical protein
MDAVKNEIALSESSSLSPAQKRFLEALRYTLGNVSEACTVTGTARATHYLWRKSRAYAEAVEEIEEACLDRAESALFRLIEEGNVPAVIFYLKTKGKKRGYSERVEIDASPAPVTFVFTQHGSAASLATDD